LEYRTLEIIIEVSKDNIDYYEKIIKIGIIKIGIIKTFLGKNSRTIYNLIK